MERNNEKRNPRVLYFLIFFVALQTLNGSFSRNSGHFIQYFIFQLHAYRN